MEVSSSADVVMRLHLCQSKVARLDIPITHTHSQYKSEVVQRACDRPFRTTVARTQLKHSLPNSSLGGHSQIGLSVPYPAILSYLQTPDLSGLTS